jgi:methylase of polypeptide subunit release factors
MDPRDEALVALGNDLRRNGYRFVTITPASHRRVNARPANAEGVGLADAFGWSRPFRSDVLPAPLVALLETSHELEHCGGLLRSRVRFSTLGEQIFVHSAFPTDDHDAVFFGPDTYRFTRLIRQSLAGLPTVSPFRIIDIGCGSGVGGLHAAALMPGRPGVECVLADISPKALRFSRINAVLNGMPATEITASDVLGGIAGTANLIVSNPPYLVDPLARLYRHGGGALGFELSLRIVRESIARLAPGGRLVLYTGTAVIDGTDAFHQALTNAPIERRHSLTYEEIDPDVFGEELERSPYDRADRIAAVAIIVDAPT